MGLDVFRQELVEHQAGLRIQSRLIREREREREEENKLMLHDFVGFCSIGWMSQPLGTHTQEVR